MFDLKAGEGKLSQAADMAVEFTPDGSSLIIAHYGERRLRYWRRDDLQLTNGRTIAQLSDLPLWASLSPDGRQVAVVGRDQFVSIYDLGPTTGDTDTAVQPRQLVSHEQNVLRAIFGPDGRQLATVGGDMTVRIWDLGPETTLRPHRAKPSSPCGCPLNLNIQAPSGISISAASRTKPTAGSRSLSS